MALKFLFHRGVDLEAVRGVTESGKAPTPSTGETESRSPLPLRPLSAGCPARDLGVACAGSGQWAPRLRAGPRRAGLRAGPWATAAAHQLFLQFPWPLELVAAAPGE